MHVYWPIVSFGVTQRSVTNLVAKDSSVEHGCFKVELKFAHSICFFELILSENSLVSNWYDGMKISVYYQSSRRSCCVDFGLEQSNQDQIIKGKFESSLSFKELPLFHDANSLQTFHEDRRLNFLFVNHSKEGLHVQSKLIATQIFSNNVLLKCTGINGKRKQTC